MSCITVRTLFYKITRDDFEHLRTQGHANSPQKESVMDRVSNMVEDIRVNIQEDRDQDQEDRDNDQNREVIGDFAHKRAGTLDAPDVVKTRLDRTQQLDHDV